MKVIQLTIIVSCFMLNDALGLSADPMVEPQGGEERERSIHKGDKPGKAPMRIEDKDGTLRPLPPSAVPESRMSTEGLEEVPDAGGGTKVNVEGRFQSILQVPEGSDKAIHGQPEHQPPQP